MLTNRHVIKCIIKPRLYKKRDNKLLYEVVEIDFFDKINDFMRFSVSRHFSKGTAGKMLSTNVIESVAFQ